MCVYGGAHNIPIEGASSLVRGTLEISERWALQIKGLERVNLLITVTENVVFFLEASMHIHGETSK